MTQYIHYQGILICKGILAGQLKLILSFLLLRIWVTLHKKMLNVGSQCIVH